MWNSCKHYKTERIEKNLIESEEKFGTLAESSPIGIIVYQDDKFVYVNNEITKISGYSIEELLNMNYWDIVHPDDKIFIKEKVRKRQEGETEKENYELRLLTKDGNIK